MAGNARVWWGIVNRHIDIVAELVAKAKAADLAETGHDCGHEWEITIRSRRHSVGVVGEDPPAHSDADYWAQCEPVTVRAHSLHGALAAAMALPLGVWFGAEGGEPR